MTGATALLRPVSPFLSFSLSGNVFKPRLLSIHTYHHHHHHLHRHHPVSGGDVAPLQASVAGLSAGANGGGERRPSATSQPQGRERDRDRDRDKDKERDRERDRDKDKAAFEPLGGAGYNPSKAARKGAHNGAARGEERGHDRRAEGKASSQTISLEAHGEKVAELRAEHKTGTSSKTWRYT